MKLYHGSIISKLGEKSRNNNQRYQQVVPDTHSDNKSPTEVGIYLHGNHRSMLNGHSSPRQQHKGYKQISVPSTGGDPCLTWEKARSKQRDSTDIRDQIVIENVNQERHTTSRQQPNAKHNETSTPRIKQITNDKGQGHVRGHTRRANSLGDKDKFSFTVQRSSSVSPRENICKKHHNRSLDQLENIRLFDQQRMMSTMVTKPKVVKSVRFAPDVKYVCRENRSKPAKRLHTTGTVFNTCPLSGSTEQLPAVVEKYMIRSLPFIPDIMTSQDHSANIIYLKNIGLAYSDSTDRGQSLSDHYVTGNSHNQSDASSTNTPRKQVHFYLANDKNAQFSDKLQNRPSFRNTCEMGQNQKQPFSGEKDIYFPQISREGPKSPKTYQVDRKTSVSMDMPERLVKNREAQSDRLLSTSLPSLDYGVDNTTHDQHIGQSTDTYTTGADLSRDNKKPPRMVFTVQTNVHDKKPPSQHPRPGLRSYTRSGYTVSFCAL